MVAQSEMSTTVKMECTEGRQALFQMEHCIKDTVDFLSKHILFLLTKKGSAKQPHEIFKSKWNYVAIALVILAVILDIALMLSRRLQSATPFNAIIAGLVVSENSYCL
uniref:Uncharacterized protein n=1 Tax=Trichobilharzia regenti TaxID=157069 RepID=A0AA85IVR8_TRIRE|nr:unnamed protein product [Trichobilharzia regenti]